MKKYRGSTLPSPSLFIPTSHMRRPRDLVTQAQLVPQRLLWEPQPHVQHPWGCSGGAGQLPGPWPQQLLFGAESLNCSGPLDHHSVQLQELQTEQLFSCRDPRRGCPEQLLAASLWGGCREEECYSAQNPQTRKKPKKPFSRSIPLSQRASSGSQPWD